MRQPVSSMVTVGDVATWALMALVVGTSAAPVVAAAVLIAPGVTATPKRAKTVAHRAKLSPRL